MEKSVSPENLGQRLRICRNVRDLTLADVGLWVGKAASSISDWEKGKSEPSLRDIATMAEKLGCNPGLLAFGYYGSTGAAGTQDLGLAGTPESAVRLQIRDLFEATLRAAGDSPDRLGWIAEQLRQHLRTPKHWVEEDQVPDVTRVVIHPEARTHSRKYGHG